MLGQGQDNSKYHTSRIILVTQNCCYYCVETMPKENDNTNTEHCRKACELYPNKWPQFSLDSKLYSKAIKEKENNKNRRRKKNTSKPQTKKQKNTCNAYAFLSDL